MVMLSDLLRLQVADPDGRQVRLFDLGIALGSADYPRVDRLLLRGPGKAVRELTWQTVVEIDWQHSLICVTELQAAREISSEYLAELILLKRDVRDALILDLAARQAT